MTRDRLAVALVLLIAGVVCLLESDTRLFWPAYLVGATGLLILHERLRREWSAAPALIATLLVFLGTSLFWVMSHAPSVWEAVSFAVVAVALLAQAHWRAPHGVRLATWVFIAVAPLMIHALLLPRRADSVGWEHLLFSSSDGILALTPVVYLALLGTILDARRDWQRGLPTLLILGVWMAMAAFVPVAGPSGRFGHGLTPALALLAPGLATLLEVTRRRPWLAVAMLVTGALSWNYWLMVQYTVGLVPKDAPVSFSALVRQQADVHTRTPYMYPFAFPVNVWFAWREGVPVDRYELLAFEPRRASLDLTLSRDASRFLLDGWEPLLADSGDSLAWTRQRVATLAVPLDLPAGAHVDLIITARARLDNPPVHATLGVEVNGREVGRVVVPPSIVADLRVPIEAEVGSVFRAGYNRLAFVSHGVARLDAADERPPGPMASRLGDRPWPVAIHRIRITVREP